jgi:hypothetical protein
VALVVEDGSIVTGANSYVDVATARTYATDRGLTLSADDATVESQLVLAMDYLEALRDEYQGSKTDTTTPQNLQWPRQNVVIDGEDFSDSAIPVELVDAQCRLAVEQETGYDLFPTDSGKFITKEQTGPLVTEYSEKIVPGQMPRISAVDSLLKPLFSKNLGSASLTTIRI